MSEVEKKISDNFSQVRSRVEQREEMMICHQIECDDSGIPLSEIGDQVQGDTAKKLLFEAYFQKYGTERFEYFVGRNNTRFTSRHDAVDFANWCKSQGMASNILKRTTFEIR